MRTLTPPPEAYTHKAYAAVRGGLLAKLTKVADEVAPTASTLRRGSDVVRRPAAYLWHPYFPLGEVTGIAGSGEAGKTWLAVAVISSLTAGGELPANPARKGSRPARFKAPEDVLLIQRENSESMILDRVEALGGDVRRLLLPGETFVLSHEAEEVESFLRLAWYIETTGARFVFIDPITGFLKGRMRDAQEVRVVLERLRTVAEFTGCAITFVVHLNKDYEAPIEHRVMGSVEFFNVPRSILMVSSDPDTPKLEGVEDKVIYQRKNNNGVKGGPVGFRLAGDLAEGSLAFEWREVSGDRGLEEVTSLLNGTAGDSKEERTKPGRIRDTILRLLWEADEVVVTPILKDMVSDRLGGEDVPPAAWSRAVQGLPFNPIEVVDVGPPGEHHFVPQPADVEKRSGVWGYLPVASYEPRTEVVAVNF